MLACSEMLWGKLETYWSTYYDKCFIKLLRWFWFLLDKKADAMVHSLFYEELMIIFTLRRNNNELRVAEPILHIGQCHSCVFLFK